MSAATAVSPSVSEVVQPRDGDRGDRGESQSGPSTTANADLQALIRAAQERYDSIPNFTAKFLKREVVRGKLMATEEADYAFRKQPLSIYLYVTSPAGQGREVLYVAGRDRYRMHLVTGKGDHFFRGVKTVMAIDDPRAKEKSRYCITEAQFGRTLSVLAQSLANGTATLKPNQYRPEFLGSFNAVEMQIAPGHDPQLPRGGIRTVYLGATPGTAEYLLPVLVQTWEPDGREVEYYRFTELKVPGGLTDADFDPARLGKRRG